MIILLFVNYAKYVEKKTKSIKIRTKTDNSKEGKNKKTNRKDDKIIKINVKKQKKKRICVFCYNNNRNFYDLYI